MYDVTKADHAVNFINCLKHTKGKWRGVPFELLSWQDEIIRTLFGTVKENGYRQYNTCYCEIPKKNGKSELAAAIALYMTCGDGEWGAEVYGCASDRQQASIVFDVAKQMVEMSPALMKRSKLMGATKRIVNYSNAGYYQVLSAEVGGKHGFSVSGLVFDEIHTQPNRQLYDVLTKGSSDARQNPLHFIITTAGNDRHSIAFELHTKAVDILEGRRVDPTFYPVVYGLKDDEDWEDEANWYKVNPSLGYTVDIERLRDAYREAKQNPADRSHSNRRHWARHESSQPAPFAFFSWLFPLLRNKLHISVIRAVKMAIMMGTNHSLLFCMNSTGLLIFVCIY